MKRIISFLMTGMIVLTMGLSAAASEASSVELDVQPRGIGCPYCSGSTSLINEQQTDWVKIDEKPCPDGKMGCMHAIKESVIVKYYQCHDCGRIVSTKATITKDWGHFTA